MAPMWLCQCTLSSKKYFFRRRACLLSFCLQIPTIIVSASRCICQHDYLALHTNGPLPATVLIASSTCSQEQYCNSRVDFLDKHPFNIFPFLLLVIRQKELVYLCLYFLDTLGRLDFSLCRALKPNRPRHLYYFRCLYKFSKTFGHNVQQCSR